MPDDVQAIERRLDTGDWLLPGEVARLLGVSRTTVHRYLGTRIRYRHRGGGRLRECHPDDVRTLLAEARRIHGPDEG
jgi:DNA-binding GntR family transcriptional regulator